MRCLRRPAAAAITAILLAGLTASPGAAAPQILRETTVQPAMDAIFSAFATHPLVGLAESHGLAEAGEFYDALMRDPRFASQVGNVVVEFGSSAHQGALDRYLAGEEVPYSELRKVWGEVVGWDPTVTGVMYQNFFAQVRAVNQQLPAARRIRVWLGEPAIDWKTIHSPRDLMPYIMRRDEVPAGIINRNILAEGKKALVIYGGMHFTPLPSPPGAPQIEAVKQRVEKDHPGAFYVVSIYAGYSDAACAAAFEADVKWPKGVVAAPVKDTALEKTLMRPGCSFGDGPRPPPGAPSLAAEEAARIDARAEEIRSGVAGDALLYLGPAAGLTRSPEDPALIMDTSYFKEVSRRLEIMSGKPASFADWAARAGPTLPYSR